MKKSFLPHSRKGFTLIELIIVIAILATLASIAYPTYMSIQDNAKGTAAKKACLDIVEGVTRYAQDNNGMLPYDAKEVEPDKKDQIYLETSAGKDARLIQILTNREEDDDNRLNVTRDTYLRSDEQDKPFDGLYIDSSDGINFYDPWGHSYQVVLCEEEKGCIDPFNAKKRFRGKKCLVYSLGSDGEGMGMTSSTAGTRKPAKGAAAEAEEESIEDNIYSWKNAK
ncbi:MAG: prepilin-type N-terminal cleavage/methylation domain-containing protein [Akkermansia sp.]|nr:prepilin-type N-terminal cleavage/methylation domain-containing protein [Akkermansia sp.]